METIQNNSHLSGETLERYVMGKLPSLEVARISEHLIECDVCNELYEKEAEYLTAARKAARKVEEELPKATLWSRFMTLPGPLVAAGATAVLALTLLVPRLSESPAGPALAELTAYRNAAATSAPANRSLVLRLDTTGLEGQFRADLADSAGNSVWHGSPVQKDGQWEALVDRRLAPGQYWVRLYSIDDSELLREFSLQLK